MILAHLGCRLLYVDIIIGGLLRLLLLFKFRDRRVDDGAGPSLFYFYYIRFSLGVVQVDVLF